MEASDTRNGDGNLPKAAAAAAAEGGRKRIYHEFGRSWIAFRMW